MTKEDLQMEFEVKTMFNCIVKINHPYLQAWANAGAYVMLTGGDFWIFTSIGQLWLKFVSESEIHLECIAVNSEERRKGNGGQLMKYVTDIADQTNTRVSLEVSDVTQGGFMGMPHPVVAAGQKKTNKIPVAALPKWYESKGFKKTPEYSQKKKSMLYIPVKK